MAVRFLIKSTLKANLVKGLLTPAQWIGEKILLNHNLPQVGRCIEGLPYGDHPRQVMDVMLPMTSPPHPVLVFFHGGGFILGSRRLYNRLCRAFTAQGYLTCNVDYRLAPNAHFPAPLQDVSAALSLIRERASSWGADPSRLFLAGDSAGALLVCWYAAAVQKPGLLRTVELSAATTPLINGLLLFYGVYDLETARETGFPFIKTMADASLGPDPGTYAARAQIASPLRHIRPGLPPIFLCAGEADSLYPESLALAKALKHHQVPHETLFFSRSAFPTARHGFMFFPSLGCTRIAMERAIGFLGQAAFKAIK